MANVPTWADQDIDCGDIWPQQIERILNAARESSRLWQLGATTRSKSQSPPPLVERVALLGWRLVDSPSPVIRIPPTLTQSGGYRLPNRHRNSPTHAIGLVAQLTVGVAAPAIRVTLRGDRTCVILPRTDGNKCPVRHYRIGHSAPVASSAYLAVRPVAPTVQGATGCDSTHSPATHGDAAEARVSLERGWDQIPGIYAGNPARLIRKL